MSVLPVATLKMRCASAPSTELFASSLSEPAPVLPFMVRFLSMRISPQLAVSPEPSFVAVIVPFIVMVLPSGSVCTASLSFCHAPEPLFMVVGIACNVPSLFIVHISVEPAGCVTLNLVYSVLTVWPVSTVFPLL